MEIIGQQLISADRATVWKALNNVEVLKKCLPGCESVEQASPEVFKVVIKTVIGPLRARFQGELRMTEVNEPESCVMLFEGQGGAVGFGKGSAKVVLREVAQGTELAYDAKAQIGGKLAQVGSRLIDSVAKKMADDFFKAFKEVISPTSIAEVSAAQPHASGKSKHTPRTNDTTSTSNNPTPSSTAWTLVPGWWLIVAAGVGALLTIAGSHWIH